MDVSSYRVHARNLSHASENRIHDDAVARRFGFQGALVPGVEVYAYLSHLPAARWGADWLERGTAECRFAKPVYDGRLVEVHASASGATLTMTLDSEGERCATGAAALPADAAAAPAVPQPATIPGPEARPAADESSLAVGRRLSSPPLHVTAEALLQYLGDIGERAPLYARERIVHPALALRLANAALKANVKLGPWIHAASSIRHHALARAGETLAAHALVAANYERKGHRYVELDVVIVSDETRAVARIRHTVIYRLRHTPP